MTETSPPPLTIRTTQGLPAPNLGQWQGLLEAVVASPKMADLVTYLNWRGREQSAEMYPPAAQIFRALLLTPPSSIKVVILGQDPYHGPGQAHGLAFSVQRGCPIPPSLDNIRKELVSDVGASLPAHGDLTSWAEQGVLLLNTLLSVERSKPMAHKGKGWEPFTDAVIKVASATAPPSVFMLWGNPARRKKELIDQTRHLVIEEVHPSPLSAHRGFFGSRPFSRANQFLIENGRTPIEWDIPEQEA